MAGKHRSEALWTWVIPASSPLPRGSRSSLRSPAVASCCDVRATLGTGEQASGVTSPTESAWASAQEAEWRPHAGLARLPLLTLPASHRLEPGLGRLAPLPASGLLSHPVLGRVRTRLPAGGQVEGAPPSRGLDLCSPQTLRVTGPAEMAKAWLAHCLCCPASAQAPAPFRRTAPHLPPSPSQGTSSCRITPDSRMSGGCLF